MSTNGQLVFTDVDKITFKGVGNTSNAVVDTVTGKIGVGIDSPDANLHVLGNSYVSTNLELGGTLIMGTVNVSAHHSLEAVTAEGNTTPLTIEFSNATTGIVTTGNVEVGKELTVTGSVGIGGAAGTEQLTVHGDINLASNGNLKINGQNAAFSNWNRVNNDISYSPGDVTITNGLTVSGHSQISNATISTTTTDGGAFHWCLRASGRPRSDSGQGEGTRVTNDSTGNVYVTGSFQQDATLYDKDDIVRGSITNPRTQSFIIKYSYSGDIQWYTRAGSPTSAVDSRDGGIDTNGNYYITGTWYGTEINFYNEDGTVGDTITHTANSGEKGYLVKYNANGDVQWSTHFVANGGSFNYTRAMNVDTDGENIYVVGQFGATTTSTLDLYSASSSSVADTLSNTGNADAFIAKYNSSGVLQWRARLGGSGDQYTSTSSLSIDNNGNIYVTALYNGALAIYNADDSQAATFSSSGLDAYITKYNSSGVHQWSTRISGSGSEKAYGLRATNDGAVYVSGSYTSSMLFYNVNGATTGLSHSGNEDAFIAKYNSSGVLQWRTRIAGTSIERGEDISVDSAGNVYIGGTLFSQEVNFYNKDDTVANTTSFNSTAYKGCIAKYDSNGNFVWRQLVTGEGSACHLNSISIGNDDNVYFTGTYHTDALYFYNNGILAGTLGRIDTYEHMFVARYSGIGKTTLINSKRTYDTIALNASGGNIGIGTNAPMCALDVRGDLKVGGRGIIETLTPRYYSSMQRGTFDNVSSHIITGFDHQAEGYATPALGWEVHINFNHHRNMATHVEIDGGYLSTAPSTHVSISETATRKYDEDTSAFSFYTDRFYIGSDIAHAHAAVYAVIRITNSQVPGIQSAIHAGNGSTVRYHMLGHTMYVKPGVGSCLDVAIGQIPGGNNARLHGIRVATGAGNITGSYTVYTYH